MKGTREERATEVAQIASRLFGTRVGPEHVIGETLRSVIRRAAPTGAELGAALQSPPVYAMDYAALVTDPVAAWAETGFGIQRDGKGRLERKPPVTLTEAVRTLATHAGVGEEACRRHLQAGPGEAPALRLAVPGRRIDASDPDLERHIAAFTARDEDAFPSE